MENRKYSEDEMKRLHQIFDVLYDVVVDQSGDGWGAIVSKDYKQLAQLFEEWDKDMIFPYGYKFESDNYIGFSYSGTDEECIKFTDDFEYAKDNDIVILLNERFI